MAVNVKSIYLTGRFGLPTLVEKGSGAVVNIASVFGFTVNKDECAYAASKGAVINLTRRMEVQTCARRHSRRRRVPVRHGYSSDSQPSGRLRR